MHEPQNLLAELKEFYQNYYSADRMRLAIQVKTDDNLVELRNQVTKIFSVVPTKKLGL